MSISLVDKKVADSYDISYPVILSNPLNAEMSHLRTNLAYCALQTVRSNFFKGEKYLRLFEIGNIFTKKEDKEIEVLNDLNQTENLLILMSGLAVQMNSFEKPRNIDIFDIKGEVEALLSKFCLDKHRFIYYDYEGGLNSDKIGIQIEELNVGYLGKIPPNYLKQFDIDEDVYFCEINIGYLEKATHYQRKYSAPSRFPFVSRDLAFIVADSVPQSGVESAIRAMGTELLDSIQLFDVYEGENIGKGKKNLAYALRFQPRERTLTDEEIDEIIKRIVKNVNEQCGGVLRS
jgi:phenylalanyl-tRNA synthetase beta chain